MTQVRVEFMDDPSRSIIRNVKGPGKHSQRSESFALSLTLDASSRGRYSLLARIGTRSQEIEIRSGVRETWQARTTAIEGVRRHGASASTGYGLTI